MCTSLDRVKAKINLLGSKGAPELVYSLGIGRAEMRRLMQEVEDRQHAFVSDRSASMGRLADCEFEAAERRGRERLETAPRASGVRYDVETRRVVIELADGCAYAFPVGRVQGLQGASDDDLKGVEVDGAGFNLHWPSLDVDLDVPALVTGMFGTRAWMALEFARRAGKVKSPAKAAAARANGAKGGRPRRSA